ncbi:DDE superfamily endonuclease [Hirsutella rhossiliensis]
MNGLNWPKPNLNRENWSLKILNRDPKNSIHLIHPSFKIFKKFTFVYHPYPPFIIVSGKCHLSTWYEDSDIPRDWVISTSDNGWTTNERGLEWIRHFDRHTKPRSSANYRLLILDGHESHHSTDFELYCKGNNIVTLSTDADTLGRGSRKTRTLGF